MTRAVIWFRRDLRLADHPALLAALASADEVLPVFVLDPALARAGSVRTERLLASLASLDASMGGALVVRTGDPRRVVPALAAEIGAAEVHITRETTPYGRRRDAAVARALAAAGRSLVVTGSSYAAGPGRVVNAQGRPYQVFTPFSKAWRALGPPAPAPAPARPRWLRGVTGVDWVGGVGGVGGEALRHRDDLSCVGEVAALSRWRDFLDHDLAGYASARDRPDLDTTSRLSIPLKYGEIHPRTLFADLASQGAGREADVERFATELIWREFYADVLWHHPESAWSDLRPSLEHLSYDSGPAADLLVDAWREGRTGFPIVDAGMRQLLAEGWMHNRVRMITASFLTKDLHVWWPVGARHFLDHLLDGDLASNNHGWQWVAGTGTDAAPYFRVFNPTTQGRTFDPDGDYVRRWVPELRHLAGRAAHEPWTQPDGHAHGYPERIVDHAEERAEALARYAAARATRDDRAG